MKLPLAALLLAAAIAAPAPALGAAPGIVHRGDLIVRVKVEGTVVADDVFRLKSTIEGRVESVNTSTGVWRGSDQPLAVLSFKELAAMIDARGTQSQDLLEDRWSKVYRPTPVRCPDTCYVLKAYAKPHAWVKPQAVLFEAAPRLKLVGRVRPEDVPLIRDGMTLTFWSVKKPARTMTGKITRFILDVQGEKVEPGGTFTLDLSPDRYLDPGTDWAGEIIPLIKPGVLIVPTAALISHDGVAYLPVRVSTGITRPDFTEIQAGIDENHQILILSDSELHGAERHAQSVDSATFQLARPRDSDVPPPPARPAARPEQDESEEPAKPQKQPETLDDKSYGGEDPYGEQ